MTPRPVEVTWLDIVSSHRWDDTDASELRPIECKQLGYLVVDEPDRVVLVNTITDDEGTGGATAIPRGCVVSVTDVAPTGQQSTLPPTE